MIFPEPLQHSNTVPFQRVWCGGRVVVAVTPHFEMPEKKNIKKKSAKAEGPIVVDINDFIREV